MGCDIHAYIVFRETFDNGNTWEGCWSGRLFFTRNYVAFGALAGVRVEDIEPVVSPRGIPTDWLPYDVADDYYLTIREADQDEWKEGECNPSDAARWQARGLSRAHPQAQGRISSPDWHTPSWLTAAEVEEANRRFASFRVYDEAYTTSKRPDEMEVLRLAGRDRKPVTIEPSTGHPGSSWWDVKVGVLHPIGRPNRDLSAIAGAMRGLEASGLEARLVFWFDN